MHARQRDFLEAGGRDALDFLQNYFERHAARSALVAGMMQYEHGSAHPVWTRSVNAVRPATPGSIAAPQLPSPSPKRSAVDRS